MIKLIGLVLMASLSANAFADDSNDTMFEANAINTLHYRTPAHGFEASLNLNSPIINTEDWWQNAGKADHYSRTSFSGTVSLGYGITDNMEVGVSENYLFSNNSTKTNETTQATTSYSSNGPSNPTVDFSYRYAGGLTGKAFSTAYVRLAPAIGTKYNPTSTESGNNYAADTKIMIGDTQTWVVGSQEFQLNPWLSYNTSGTYNNQDGTSYTNNAYTALGLNANYRHHCTEKFSLNLSLDLQLPYTVVYNNPTYVEDQSWASYMSEAISAEYKFADSWMLFLTVDNATSTALATFSDGGAIASDNFQVNNVNLGANFIF